jgi:hypothetical protein
MGVDDYRDREGDAEQRTGVGQGESVGVVREDAGGAVSGDRDAEERTGLGSDPEGADSGFSDAATEGGEADSG